MKQIVVFSRKHGTKIIKVSDRDYALVSSYKWSVFLGHSTYYAVTKWVDGNKVTTKFIHRLILGAKSNEFVDHRDHDGLNNQRSNIRICTAKQNSMNMRRHSDNLTGLKGVSFDPRKNKYYARIRVGRRSVSLGNFHSPELAAKAYNKAAKKHFKNFAKLN